MNRYDIVHRDTGAIALASVYAESEGAAMRNARGPMGHLDDRGGAYFVRYKAVLREANV